MFIFVVFWCLLGVVLGVFGGSWGGFWGSGGSWGVWGGILAVPVALGGHVGGDVCSKNRFCNFLGPKLGACWGQVGTFWCLRNRKGTYFSLFVNFQKSKHHYFF